MLIYRSPGGRSPRFLSSPAEFLRWAFLPYGQWTTADGREILFNRFYEPIWQRRSGEPPSPADPTEWVAGIQSQTYCYSESDRYPRQMALETLAAWGLPAPDKAQAKALRQP